MRSISPRLLYVPNEDGVARQHGLRRALRNLLDAGLVEDVAVFSLLHRIRSGTDPRDAADELVDRTQSLKPNIILMQHLGGTGLSAGHFRDLLDSSDNGRLIYHEGDPYTRFKHPLPREARAAAKVADVVFTVGTGTFSSNFARAGARDVRYVPHVVIPESFGTGPLRMDPQREFDVVMIANRAKPRLRGLPNWEERIAFVEYLAERYGDRFAIFGRGWSGPCAKGPIDYADQAATLGRGWVAANWDHFRDEPHYFSDRLPITLASGSIHVCSWHPGYDEMFGPATHDFLKPVRSFSEAALQIDRILDETSPQQRIDAGLRARAFAMASFRQDDQLVSMLNYREQVIDPVAAKHSWDLTASGLTDL